MFSRKGFYNSLNHRFVRTKKNGDKIENIYDGAIYQKQLKSKGFLSQRNNISFTWNTDGIPGFKSSKYRIWPLYLTINELSPQKRWRSDNILLAGLWFGPQKPNMLSFLNPFNPLSRISHLSGSHASLMHAIAYNPIAKELIRLAKKFKYHFTHH